ncbi:MAG: AAA family ATPase, partial [Nanoarchaeota archaeon]
MDQKPKTEELIIEARNFFDYYKKELGKSIREGQNVMLINFSDLASFSHLLSDLLLSYPEETFQILETSLQESGLVNNPRIRMTELPEEFSEKIRNLRAKHLNRLIQVEGIVRQASEVRPQVISAKFECPSCGTVLSLLQVESKFREPTRCSCGRRGSFKLLSKDMVDAQRIVVEEAPDNLSGGEQPRRLSIFLKEDLVEPKMEEKTTPGSRIKVIGILKEIARHSQTGGTLTRYDIAVEANNLIAMEETFENLDISDEDEKQIEELAADKQVLEKFTSSIAPSIYGYEEVKKSLVLQLFSGVGRKRSDGTHSRGDIHILLVGDPGVAKSVILKYISSIAPKG